MRKIYYYRLILSSLFLFPAVIGISQTEIASISGLSDTECIGSITLFQININSNTLADVDGMGDPSGITLIDNNPGDLITGIVGCFNCIPMGNGSVLIIINIGGGTPGTSVTFDLLLEDPNGFTFSNLSLLPNQGISFVPPILTYRFTVNVDGPPIVDIIPSDPLICNGASTVLTAVSTNGASITNYSWSAGNGDGSFQGNVNPGNSPVATVTDQDIYEVMASNMCGLMTPDFESVTVEAENTPVIDLTCTDNGDNSTTLKIDLLNNADNVTVEVFNEGNFYTDFSIPDGPGSVMTTIDNNVYFNQDFTVTASNGCGNSSNMEACPIMIPLPVELQYFQATRQENGILLEWATLTETNNDYFTIEKSFDGVSFEQVTTVPGMGTTLEPQQYVYLDQKAGEKSGNRNVLYYRLKQTDFDGTFTYSEIVAVNLPSKGALAVNRLWQENQTLVADLAVPFDTQLDLRLFNLDGRLLNYKRENVAGGNAQLKFDLIELPPGIYLISVNDGQQLITQKFLKK